MILDQPQPWYWTICGMYKCNSIPSQRIYWSTHTSSTTHHRERSAVWCYKVQCIGCFLENHHDRQPAAAGWPSQWLGWVPCLPKYGTYRQQEEKHMDLILRVWRVPSFRGYIHSSFSRGHLDVIAYRGDPFTFEDTTHSSLTTETFKELRS